MEFSLPFARIVYGTNLTCFVCLLFKIQPASSAQECLELTKHPGTLHLHGMALRQQAPAVALQDIESGGQEEVHHWYWRAQVGRLLQQYDSGRAPVSKQGTAQESGKGTSQGQNVSNCGLQHINRILIQIFYSLLGLHVALQLAFWYGIFKLIIGVTGITAAKAALVLPVLYYLFGLL